MQLESVVALICVLGFPGNRIESLSKAAALRQLPASQIFLSNTIAKISSLYCATIFTCPLNFAKLFFQLFQKYSSSELNSINYFPI